MVDRLDELMERESASIREINKILSGLSIARLDDSELVQMGEHLLGFPTIIDEVTRHPAFYKKGFDLVAYYHSVKGRITPKLADSHIHRLMRFRNHLTRYSQQCRISSKKPHELVKPLIHDISEVEEHFRDLDIYDGRRLPSVLNGTTMVFHCPDIIPHDAVKAFGHRWYSARQFHGDYEWGVKTTGELRGDGRKKMFLEGIGNLNQYLRTNS